MDFRLLHKVRFLPPWLAFAAAFGCATTYTSSANTNIDSPRSDSLHGTEVEWSGDNTSAGNNDAGHCGGNRGNDIRLRWEAERSGTFRFSTLGSTFDTVLYAHQNGHEIACNDDLSAQETTSAIDVTVAAGETLTLVIDGYDRDSVGMARLEVTEIRRLQAPSPVQGTGVVWSGSTSAYANHSEGTCGGAGSDIRLEWTAPASAIYRLSTQGSTVDTVLHVRHNEVEVSCNDDASSTPAETWSATEVAVRRGQRLIVSIDTHVLFERGTAQLSIEPVIEDSAEPITVPGTYSIIFSGDTTNHRNRSGGECGGEEGRDAGQLWVAPETGHYRFSTAGSDFDTVLHIHSGPQTGEEIACNDNVAEHDSVSQIDLHLVAGQRVYVVVDGSNRNETGRAHVSVVRIQVPERVVSLGDLGQQRRK